MQTKAAKIYLKTPYRKWLWLGGLAACALPFLVCLVLLLLSALDTSDPNTRGAIYITFSDMFVILLIPIVGTIIAAFLGTREILKKNKHGFSGKGSFVWIGLKAGFFAHCIIAFLFFLIGLVFDNANMDINSLIQFIVIGGTVTFVVWAFVTLPISLICGYVFWFVAVRGSENLMAEVFD